MILDAYKEAGVDISSGNEAVERMKKHARRTFRPEVLTGLGGFSGQFKLNVSCYNEPVLVSGADGVGTKLKIAFAMDKHDTIGIDAVAMCVNDILVQGAEPLFFLDYLAFGRIEPEKVERIIKGVADGCSAANCSLIGGETAEMPGFYSNGEYDIAGFAVGIANKKDLIDGSGIKEGDLIFGLPSNGVHSNGFSLIRKLLLEGNEYSLRTYSNDLGDTLGNVLIKPTKIYAKPILNLLKSVPVKGMAHITGGGFIENIPRMLPSGLTVEIEKDSWEIPPIFSLIQKVGNISNFEMFRTFNMGIGIVLAISENDEEKLKLFDEPIYRIGKVKRGKGVEF